MVAAIEVTASPQFARWIAGMAGLVPAVVSEAGRTWDDATEVFYGRTQEFAHIDTGQMKLSGHYDVETAADEVTGRVMYEADARGSNHAMWEELRGGDHALLTRGFAASTPDYEQAMTSAFRRVVASWSS